jgi:hypothetical protein
MRACSTVSEFESLASAHEGCVATVSVFNV